MRDDDPIWEKGENDSPLPHGTNHQQFTMVPDLVWFDMVEPRDVSWLWWPYIPFGMLSMLSGDPGAGKSFLMLALAAGLSIGVLPDGRMIEPVKTLYLTVENPLAEVLVPRFIAMGGDRRKICLFRGGKMTNGSEEENFPVTLRNIDLIEQAIVDSGARFIIVDPIQSYIGADVDIHRTNQTRPVLDRLAAMVERHGCAMPLLRHLNKNTGGKAIYRGMGSIDFTGAVRCEMLAGSCPDDPENRAFLIVKSSVGPTGRARGYRIEANGKDATFRWTGDTTLSEGDILASPEAGRKIDDAEAWLREFLTREEKMQAEVKEGAKEFGFSWMTIRRAAQKIGIKPRKLSLSGPWWWRLPQVESEDVQ